MSRTALLLASLALAGEAPTLHDVVAAAGADEHDQLETLAFTFVVEMDGERRAERAWRWNRPANTVTRTVDGEALTFTPGDPANDAEYQADAHWTNDSFWFSPPMHLSWAEGVRATAEGACTHPTAPDTERQCLRVEYPPDGGYTPGDTYRLYLDDAHRIVGWDYIPAGVEKAKLQTDFTDRTTAGPLSIATHHRSPDGSFHLFFEDIAATTASGD